MLPVLVDFPQLGVAIHSRGLMIVLAAVLCHLVGPRSIEWLSGVDRRQARRALLWLLPPAFIGARLHYLLNQWPQQAAFWEGGMHAGGAIIAMAISLPLVLRHLSIPLGAFADAVVPLIAGGIAVARLGCFLRGCCYGSYCTWPWGVHFPSNALPYVDGTIPAGSPLHPVQLYFVASALGVALFALWMHARKRYDGEVALLSVLLYSLSAAAIELFRADHAGRVYWGPLPQLEWTALAMVAGSLAALAAARTARRSQA